MAGMEVSLQIGTNDVKQLLDGIRIERIGIGFAVDEMRPDMFFNDFSHQPCDRTAHGREQVHHFFAFGFCLKRTFDRFDLATQAANTSQKPLFFTDGVGHAIYISYPLTLF